MSPRYVPCSPRTVFGIGRVPTARHRHALALICALSAFVPAEEVLRLDADAADRLAREHAEAVLAARADAAADLAQVRTLEAYLYPQLSAQARYERLNDARPIDPLASGDADRDSWSAGARAEQYLWGWGVHDSAGDRRRSVKNRTAASTALAQTQAAYLARQALADWALADAALAIAGLRQTQRQDERDQTAKLAAPETALRSRTDVDQAEVSLLDSQQATAATRDARAQAMLALAAAVAAEPDVIIQPNAELAAAVPVESLLTQARAAIETGSVVQQLLESAAEFDASRRGLDADAWPTLRAWGEYGGEGEEHDDLDDRWALGIGATWSIYDGGARLADQEALRQRQRAALRRADEAIRARRTEVEQLALRCASLVERIARQEQAVALADRVYASTSATYAAGLIDLTRLGDASLTVGEQRYRLAQLRHELLSSANRLRALGE